jgi:hypothetical protein
MVSRSRRLRIWLGVADFTIPTLAYLPLFYRPTLPFPPANAGLGDRARHRIVDSAAQHSAGVGGVGPHRMRNSLRELRVEITARTVLVGSASLWRNFHFPSNWEQFVALFLLIGTAVCAFTAQNPLDRLPQISMISVSSNPDNLPAMRETSFGCFLPFGFAAVRFVVRMSDCRMSSWCPVVPRPVLPL